jgi:hypothetical protein
VPRSLVLAATSLLLPPRPSESLADIAHRGCTAPSWNRTGHSPRILSMGTMHASGDARRGGGRVGMSEDGAAASIEAIMHHGITSSRNLWLSSCFFKLSVQTIMRGLKSIMQVSRTSFSESFFYCTWSNSDSQYPTLNSLLPHLTNGSLKK